MVLSGSRALLLEVAHPLVAAAVAEHSDFRGSPLRRLFRTVGVMTAINSEPAGRAPAVTVHVRGCHGRVHGWLPEDVGPHLGGTPYRADDPLLQLCLVAALIDSLLVTCEHLARPLAQQEKQADEAGARQLARALGIPVKLMPPEFDHIQTYIDAIVRSNG